MDGNDRSDQDIERVAASVGIPPCPEILIELRAEIGRDDPDFAKIERLVVKDVGLSAALIKTVNSPFYGLSNKIGTVRHAISALGLNTLSRTVTGLVLRNSFNGAQQINMERFWDTSTKIAITASCLAKSLPGINRDDAYTFGLFQNCGIPVLMQRFPEYKETLGRANNTESRNFTDLEDEAHSTNHATVGYLLTKSWHLPEKLSTAILYHHHYHALLDKSLELSTESRDLVSVGLLADHIVAHHSKMNFSLEWYKGGAAVLAHFGLSQPEFEELRGDIINLLEQAST